MESVINDYISRELVTKPELLPLKNDTPLLESDILDSLQILRLVLFLEEQFNISVDDFEVLPENFETVDIICAYLRSQHQLQGMQA